MEKCSLCLPQRGKGVFFLKFVFLLYAQIILLYILRSSCIMISNSLLTYLYMYEK